MNAPKLVTGDLVGWVQMAWEKCPVADWAKERAIVRAILTGDWRKPGSVNAVSMAAGKLMSATSPSVQLKEERTKKASIVTRESRAGNRQIYTLLEAWISDVREEFFGTGRPPFRDLAAAAHWLEASCHSQREPVLNAEEAKECTAASIRQIHALSRMIGINYGLSISHRYLAYQKPGLRFVSRVRVAEFSSLQPLAQRITQMAAAAGVAEDALVTSVLVGSGLPLLPAAQISFQVQSRKLSEDEGISQTTATIRLHASDLTFRQLQRIHREVRRGWPRNARSSRLTAREEKALEVRKRLGPPPKSSHTYWKRFAAALSAPDWKPTRKAAQMLLLRAQRQAKI